MENKDLVNNNTFWDGVADLYENADMTKYESDIEINFIYDIFEKIQNIDLLICFGVADGSRDPFKILEFIRKKDLNYPNNIILNDLSCKLLDKCKKRLENIKNIHYISGEMKNIKINDIINLNNINCWYICGVYNANYLIEALEIYKKNKKIIGTIFTITSLCFNYTLFCGDNKISFNIDNYSNNIINIEKLSQDKYFIGYYIMTDTGFITTYYMESGFNRLLKSIFTNNIVITKKSKSRYILNLIKNNKKPNGIITTLNNVIGNIQYSNQIQSLKTIKECLKIFL